MFSEKDKEFLYGIKDQLVKKHKECDGIGYFNENKKVIPCQCMKILKYIMDLYKFKIPMDYWNIDYSKTKINANTKDTILNYIENLDNAIQQGIGLFLSGESRGIGKTTTACEIAKRATQKRRIVYYELMQNIINDKFTDEKLIIERIKEADLVVIDEMDDIAIKENSNILKMIEVFLRGLLPQGKAIILCSNAKSEVMNEDTGLGSLLKRYLCFIDFKGEDNSEIKNKSLKDKLNIKFDYFSHEMIQGAEEHHKNEHIFNKREYSKYSID